MPSLTSNVDSVPDELGAALPDLTAKIRSVPGLTITQASAACDALEKAAASGDLGAVLQIFDSVLSGVLGLAVKL